MEKRKTLKRLIATGVMTAFTAASLITTSYAFVTLNTEATISEFGFDIVDQEGLLLSVDGSTFFQDIDGGLIKSTILANQNKGYATAIDDYSGLHFKGVTLGGRNATTDPYKAGIYNETYKYKIGKFSQDITDRRVTFVKDALVKYSSDERSAILADTAHSNYSVDEYNLINENDVAYKHEYVAAEGRDYIFFDLWLRVAQNGVADTEVHPTYKLRFSDRTSITGKEQSVELYNELSTMATETDNRTSPRADGTTVEAGKYVAGDKILVNPADAMRLGVTVLDDSITNQTITTSDGVNKAETENVGVRVYEPSVGLGSYVVEDGLATDYTADKYKPTKNAMYTYNNSLFPLSPYFTGVEKHDGLATFSEFYDVDGDDEDEATDVLATFTWDSTRNEYNVVKMSVMVWLEGWDADYFVGMRETAISVKLGFEIDTE